MTSKQRAQLRSMANTLQPLYQIGKAGVTPAVTEQLDAALEARAGRGFFLFHYARKPQGHHGDTCRAAPGGACTVHRQKTYALPPQQRKPEDRAGLRHAYACG